MGMGGIRQRKVQKQALRNSAGRLERGGVSNQKSKGATSGNKKKSRKTVSCKASDRKIRKEMALECTGPQGWILLCCDWAGDTMQGARCLLAFRGLSSHPAMLSPAGHAG